ncbi:hypothetical protein H8M03_01690 [Sphingomonas sabuli]|uniref:Uncharacterized protein n=1 Tax=Sphingomonas sabuli TaxID=2764186 RepID=A0A7G9L3A1_9SPHN|nr:hypothetical protein [Sphingomonas sabuli]QNM83100.1 hypothetical protein H8M03_01690 [Sphingomonas sabuli]
MSLTFILFAFSIAVIAGAIGVTIFHRMFPHWGARKQGLAAASILPVMAALATLAAVIQLLSTDKVGGDMKDLALVTIVQGGLISIALGFVGGLLGALLRQRGLRR